TAGTTASASAVPRDPSIKSFCISTTTRTFIFFHPSGHSKICTAALLPHILDTVRTGIRLGNVHPAPSVYACQQGKHPSDAVQKDRCSPRPSFRSREVSKDLPVPCHIPSPAAL